MRLYYNDLKENHRRRQMMPACFQSAVPPQRIVPQQSRVTRRTTHLRGSVPVNLSFAPPYFSLGGEKQFLTDRLEGCSSAAKFQHGSGAPLARVPPRGNSPPDCFLSPS